MNFRAHFFRSLFCFLLLTVLPSLLFLGCSKESIVEPEPTIDSYDDLMLQFFINLEKGDVEALESLCDLQSGKFWFYFGEDSVDSLNIPTIGLNRCETMDTFTRMFAGEEFANQAGDLMPAVTRFEIVGFSRASEWFKPNQDDLTWWDIRTGSQNAYYRVEFAWHRSGGQKPLRTESVLNFKVRPPGSVGGFDEDFEGYALTTIDADVWHSEAEGYSPFGCLFYGFFANEEAPDIDLALSLQGSDPLKVMASVENSLDSGCNLWAPSVRWMFEPDSDWTPWAESRFEDFEYSEPGEKTIRVEMRDRWGLESQAEETITLVAPATF